jgi:hypothetical protein
MAVFVDFCLPNGYSLLTYAGRRKTAQALYEQYGNPLEQEHTGEYVAISTSGKIIVGKSFRQAVTHALEKLGKGNFVFKIGNQAVVSFWQAQAFKSTMP